MINTASLKSYSTKDLAQIAKKQGVTGWHSMKKDQLIRALARQVNSSSRSSNKLTTNASRPEKGISKKKVVAKTVTSNGHGKRVTVRASTKSPNVLRKIQKANQRRELDRDLSNYQQAAPVPAGDKPQGVVPAVRDRVVLLVRDCYWLQATWEVTRQSVSRAQAAMAEHWHTAKPTLRLIEVESNGTTSTAERVLREIPIHGGVRNWYIDVKDPPKSYRVDIGYLATNGKFFALARSNSVTTPRPGSNEAVDENWADVAENFEKVYAQSGGYSEEKNSSELQELFEERLRRPMHSPNSTRFGVGAEGVFKRRRDFQFDVDAEMVIFGSTKPDAHLMLGGEPVKIRPDGTFSVRLSMPDKRQVIPIVASSKDGVEQRTIVLAVERNTKAMEPMVKEKPVPSDD